MKKNTTTLALFGLLLVGLSLTFSACKDNDLDADGGNGNGNGKTDTEVYYAKQEALTCLLGGVASLDSLPTGWDAATYTAQPTLGKADEANPHVRYVVTSDLDEANRIYKSLIAAPVSDNVSDDTWSCEGIGTLCFKVKNEPTLFATLDVNVQQLPTLEQIRFVPASALGDNASRLQSVFYQLGDVVAEENGTDENGKAKYIYWVCVTPCSVERNIKKSHWCSFALVGKDEKNSNYVNKGSQSNAMYLPTKLCSKQQEGINMIPKFFSLLSLLANPYSYENGFPGMTTNEIKKEDFRDISYMWDYLGLWQNGKVANKSFKGIGVSEYDDDYNTPLRKTMNTYDEMNAFYYGYSSIWFGRGDYRVYNLKMSKYLRGTKHATYVSCVPETPWLYDNNAFDFSVYETGGAADKFIESDQKPRTRNQFIVRYKTGAELEGSSGDDKDPTSSFEDRHSSNKLWDVLLSKNNMLKEYDETKVPFFAFGDLVKADISRFCFKEAHDTWSNITDRNGSDAFFISASKNKDKNEYYNESKPSDRLVKIAMTHLINAYLNNKYPLTGDDSGFSPCRYIKDPALKLLYSRAMKKLYRETEIFVDKDGVDTGFLKIVNSADGTITLTAHFSSGTYNMTFDFNKWLKNNQCAYTFEKCNNVKDEDKLPKLCLFNYDDAYTFHETYSTTGRTLLGHTKAERASLRDEIAKQLVVHVLDDEAMTDN